MPLEKYLLNPTHYKEEKTIGEGNFSSVSLVHLESNSENKIALKKIPFDTDDSDSQKYFIREISIMSELNHPCLIKFVGFSLPSRDDLFYKIYSEYLPNGTLIDALQDDELSSNSSKILTPTIRSKIIYGIASGMAYLHKLNIIHRDLKPENVFLNSEYEPILSDFGLSKFCTDELKMTKRLGTPYFMAPELFFEDDDNAQPVTNKIDVYAFSITLLSMFSTKYTFTGIQPRTINQLVNHITKGKRFKIPDDVPEYYKSLIEKCWSTDPAERPSFEQILEDFDRSDDFILEGSDIEKVHDYMNSLKIHEQRSKLYGFCTSASSEDEYKQEDETQEFDFGVY